MPTLANGFTGTEIVNRVLQFIGSSDTNFTTYLQNTLHMAELRYCKLHDWSFLKKTNLSLSITNGTPTYTLNTAAIGHEMLAKNIERVYDATNKLVLTKTSLETIRRIDPSLGDGSSTTYPTSWAPFETNKIILYPPVFATATLKIDGKISPKNFAAGTADMGNTPSITYDYQEGFIKYVTALALEHEDDERKTEVMSTAMALINLDIQDDLREGEENHAFMSPDEVHDKSIDTQEINRRLWQD